MLTLTLVVSLMADPVLEMLLVGLVALLLEMMLVVVMVVGWSTQKKMSLYKTFLWLPLLLERLSGHAATDLDVKQSR